MSSRFLQKPKTAVAAAEELVLPDVVSVAVDVAREMLQSRGFRVDLTGTGSIVQGQLPKAGTILARSTVVRLSTIDPATAASGYTVVPDVRGMPIRRAINTLAVCRLDVGVNGSGVVASQNPAPGKQVKLGARVVIQCESRSRSLLSLN